MFDYRFTVAALHRQLLAYSMAPRTVPRFVSRFTNPRPPVQNGTTPKRAEDRGAATNRRSDEPSQPSRHSDV